MKKEIIRFHSKISRILSFFMLLVIPVLIIILIYNFNVFAMFGIITISIFIILIVYWINSRGRSLGEEDALEKGTATHSSILVWKMPWTEVTENH